MDLHSLSKSWPTHCDMSGRVLVPAELRKELHLEPGTRAVWVKADGSLMLKPYESVIAEVQWHFCSIGSATDIWSEELKQRRQDEAQIEQRRP